VRRVATAAAVTLLAVAALLLAALLPAVAAGAYGSAFGEDFSGAAGAAPSPAVWSLDTGGAWGNGQELQAYTTSPRNVALDGHGNLVITARHETFTGTDGVTRQYTSARLQTARRFSFTYGHVAARIQVPSGVGLWPAFWALGEPSAAAPEWPATGEIDMMELLGAHPSVAYGTIHGPAASSAEGYKVQSAYHAPSSLASGFHVYSADWSPRAISFAVDGHTYRTVTRAELPVGATWPFDHPFFLVLNLAVGGSWGGPPRASTPWPAHMTVDWVHVSPTAG
jgi:beta-glucanase (GH16 family)